MHRLDLGLYVQSSERVLGNGVRTHVNSKGKIPSTGGSEADRTRDAASRRTTSQTHYRLNYSGPKQQIQHLQCTYVSMVGSDKVKVEAVSCWHDSCPGPWFCVPRQLDRQNRNHRETSSMATWRS